jgi:SAM-dependent methyltransferase
MKDSIKSSLVNIFGWPAPLFHGDTAVLDRWLWLRERLPRCDESPKLIDIGCGSGAFTIGAALRGYQATGLSFDIRNQNIAAARARVCKANGAKFEVQDIRHLDERIDLEGRFDVAVLCEVIEHVFNDAKLVRDAARCLKPNGRLLLTTPNFDLKPIDSSHEGPFPTVENGGHVRKGYTGKQLIQLCEQAGLVPGKVSFCTGLVSQKITYLHFKLAKVHPVLAWGVVNPFRIAPLILDPLVTRITDYPPYSICIEASKPA